MQPVYEDEAITIAPHQDGCLLSDFQNTLLALWTVSGLSVGFR